MSLKKTLTNPSLGGLRSSPDLLSVETIYWRIRNQPSQVLSQVIPECWIANHFAFAQKIAEGLGLYKSVFWLVRPPNATSIENETSTVDP